MKVFFENLALCFAFHIPFYSPPNLGYLFCTPRLLACFLDEPCLWGKSPLPRHWFTDWSWIWLLQWVLDFFNVSTTLNFSGGSPEPFTLDLLSIDPFPILVQPGGLVTVAAQINLKEVIDVGAKVSFNIVMEGLIPLPIPCLDLSDLGVDTSIGSWWYTSSVSLIKSSFIENLSTYDGDEVLAAASNILCPTYVPEDQDCALPLGPGVYGGREPLTIGLGPLEDIPEMFKPFLTGTYMVEATILDSSGQSAACVWARISLDYTSTPATTATVPTPTTTPILTQVECGFCGE